jgi:hypothetical protein
MTLVGGGGAGNIAGSNPAGTGTSLNYIGNHAYASSGVVSVNNVESALLRFSTGNEYIRAIIQFNGGASGGGDNYVYRVKYDSQIIQEYVTNSNTDDSPNQKLNLIIPPYTNVECTAVNASDDSSNDQIVSLSGRVYA